MKLRLFFTLLLIVVLASCTVSVEPAPHEYFSVGEVVEAEEGILYSTMTTNIHDDVEYVYTPIGSATDIGKGGSVEFTFDVKEAGEYYLEAKIMTSGPTMTQHNSFFVGLDSEEALGNDAFVYNTRTTDSFFWDNVSLNGDPEDPHYWALDEGYYTFVFYGRENFTLLDKVKLVKKTPPHECEDNDGDGYGYNCDKGLDCNDSNPYVHFNLTCDYDGHVCGDSTLCVEDCPVPPKEVCDNGVDDDCDEQVDCEDDECSTQSPCEISSSYFYANQWIEAEEGSLEEPMQISSSNNYIFSDIFGSGVAKYSFKTTKDTRYKIKMYTQTDDIATNSVYIGFDKAVNGQDDYVWDIPLSEGFIENSVYLRSGQTVWELPAGVHTLYIYGREIDSRIDKLMLEETQNIAATCNDGIQNQDETGVDCGGVCPPCDEHSYCGDNSCDSDETCNSCPKDCICEPGVVDINALCTPAAVEKRQNDYLEALSNMDTDEPYRKVAKALAIMELADRSGDTSRIDEANNLVVQALDALPDLISDNQPHYALLSGSALDYIRMYYLFKDKPHILKSSTKEKILNGGDRSSLRYYLGKVCYDISSRGWSLKHNNPWKHPSDDYSLGTENHQIVEITQGLLLSQIYANEKCVIDGTSYPIKDSTDEGRNYANDLWHYYRNAYYEWLTMWGSEERKDDDFNFHLGWGIGEKDSNNYYGAYGTAFLNLRDFVDDADVADYSEFFFDGLTGDMAEDLVGSLYTGKHGRTSWKYVERLRQWFKAPVMHMWFDATEYSMSSLDERDLNQWGYQAYTAMATSDYNPSNPDFPRVLLEIARNKPSEGYMVTESISGRNLALDVPLYGEKANWVMPDYALGFQLDEWLGADDHEGGFYLDSTDQSGYGGLLITPFISNPKGNDKYNDIEYKLRPDRNEYGLVVKDAAITQIIEKEDDTLRDGYKKSDGTEFTPEDLPCKLWIKDGFDELIYDGSWIFGRSESRLGRDVYVAVKTIKSGNSYAGKFYDGVIRECDEGDDYFLWETSNSDEYSSFSAFRSDVKDNPLSYDSNWIRYTTSKGDKLEYNRNSVKYHKVNGVKVPWMRDYDYVTHSPYTSWPHEEFEFEFSKGGYSVKVDFDKNNDGVFDDPVKIVDNSK